jgi:hypothetical protein
MPSGLFSLPPHYQTAFDDNWKEIMAQQTQHRLAGMYVLDPNISGNQKRYDQLGSQYYAMRQKTARAQKTEPSDIPNFSRWVRPRPYDKTTWIDEDDHWLLGSLPDPQGPTVKNHAIAVSRLKDQVIINAGLGTNYTGATGTTTTTLPAGQQVAVNDTSSGASGANTGLTLYKLTKTSYIMDSQDVDDNGRVLVYSARQLNNLVTNVDQVNNVLYNDVRALYKGRIDEFMGFRFIRTQLLPTTIATGGVRTCMAYQKDFILLAIGDDMKTKIDILPDQSHAIQVRTKINLDATRLEEAGVVSILADESV